MKTVTATNKRKTYVTENKRSRRVIIGVRTQKVLHPFSASTSNEQALIPQSLCFVQAGTPRRHCSKWLFYKTGLCTSRGVEYFPNNINNDFHLRNEQRLLWFYCILIFRSRFLAALLFLAETKLLSLLLSSEEFMNTQHDVWPGAPQNMMGFNR